VGVKTRKWGFSPDDQAVALIAQLAGDVTREVYVLHREAGELTRFSRFGSSGSSAQFPEFTARNRLLYLEIDSAGSYSLVEAGFSPRR
jgi:hypothetical protein